MAQDASAPNLSLRERSFAGFGSDDKLSKWLLCSLLLHLGLIVSLFVIPLLPTPQAPIYPVYTVDLVGGEKIGASNFGTELTRAAAPKRAEPPAQVQETKKEKIATAKTVEKPVLLPEKVTPKDKTKKEQAKRESTTEAKVEAKSEKESLESVRERLIQSAVERAKNRTESGPKPSKGEEISAGTGEGDGAASLGPGGRGGGVVKGMDFIIYQNRMFETIKSNWAWVGQKSNLRVVVQFGIKDNGDVVGLKVVQPSGDPSYDESVLRAVKKSSPLPAPPESYRKDFADVEISFRPRDLGA